LHGAAATFSKSGTSFAREDDLPGGEDAVGATVSGSRTGVNLPIGQELQEGVKEGVK
jgi:hypothetical protein